MAIEIEGIVNPPDANWDRYINNSLTTNEVHSSVPDGEYHCVDEFACGMIEDIGEDRRIRHKPYGEGEPPCQFVYSTTKVKVRDGMFNIRELLKAAEELKEKSHYWGVYLERVQWVNNPGDWRKRCTTAPYKETSCERHMVEDMTDQEKELWNNGLLMLTWGS
jgi:hypothetical protein